MGDLDDLILEVVDLVGQLVHHREVAVDDPVGDRVEQEVGAFREDGADAVAHRHAPREVGRRAVDRQEELLAEDEVDLRGLDLAAVLDVEQHDMDDVVVDRDLRPLVALLDVVGDQRVQPERPRDGPTVCSVGVGQVDPERGCRAGRPAPPARRRRSTPRRPTATSRRSGPAPIRAASRRDPAASSVGACSEGDRGASLVASIRLQRDSPCRRRLSAAIVGQHTRPGRAAECETGRDRDDRDDAGDGEQPDEDLRRLAAPPRSRARRRRRRRAAAGPADRPG